MYFYLFEDDYAHYLFTLIFLSQCARSLAEGF